MRKLFIPVHLFFFFLLRDSSSRERFFVSTSIDVPSEFINIGTSRLPKERQRNVEVRKETRPARIQEILGQENSGKRHRAPITGARVSLGAEGKGARVNAQETGIEGGERKVSRPNKIRSELV